MVFTLCMYSRMSALLCAALGVNSPVGLGCLYRRMSMVWMPIQQLTDDVCGLLIVYTQPVK